MSARVQLICFLARAKDYHMPELKQVQPYDFRRFKASKEYHLTGKLLLVKELLRHKDTRSTERYISLFDEKNITWIPVVATTEERDQTSYTGRLHPRMPSERENILQEASMSCPNNARRNNAVQYG